MSYYVAFETTIPRNTPRKAPFSSRRLSRQKATVNSSQLVKAVPPTHIDDGAVPSRPSIVVLPPIPRGAPDDTVADRDAADGRAARPRARGALGGAQGRLRCTRQA